VRAEPLRRDRREPLAGEAPDLAERLPRVQLPLETLDPLRLGLLDSVAHLRPRTERAEGGTRSGSGRSAFLFAASTAAVTLPIRRRVKRSGTSSHDFERPRSAVARWDGPPGGSRSRPAPGPRPSRRPWHGRPGTGPA